MSFQYFFFFSSGQTLINNCCLYNESSTKSWWPCELRRWKSNLQCNCFYFYFFNILFCLILIFLFIKLFSFENRAFNISLLANMATLNLVVFRVATKFSSRKIGPKSENNFLEDFIYFGLNMYQFLRSKLIITLVGSSRC